MNKDYLRMYTDPIPEQSDYAQPKKKSKRKKKAPAPVKQLGGLKVVDMDVRVESRARDSDSSSDDAPVIEVNDDDEEQFAYAQRMKRARERNAARWKEYDIDGKVIIKEEDHGADLSPPRSRGNDADLSPPRSRGGADISPPRSIKTEDLSPPRSRSADMSPPRVRVKREPGTDDFSPPRGVGGDTDMSPPRRHSTAGDMSPPRRARSDTADLSPNRDLSPARRKPRTLEGGGRAGLFLGDDAAKEEEEMKKRKMEQLKRMDPTASGMGAATVYRDRRGKILPGLTQMIAQEEGKTYEDASTNYDWGVGRRDIEAEVALKRREEEESGRGYRGIGRDDERLNEEKREQDRFGDPMAKFIPKSSSSGGGAGRDMKKLTMRAYRGRLWSNRYNIRPGWRWDGIDRTNKFEDRLFHSLNEKNVQEMRDMHFGQAEM